MNEWSKCFFPTFASKDEDPINFSSSSYTSCRCHQVGSNIGSSSSPSPPPDEPDLHFGGNTRNRLMAHILAHAATTTFEKRELVDSTYSTIRSNNACLLTSFSTEFLFGSKKSKTTRHRPSLLTNRLCFSEFGTSLKETNGSMPSTTLEGKTADDIHLMTEAGRDGSGTLPQLLVRCIPLPLLL
jgi:hypothetical protein